MQFRNIDPKLSVDDFLAFVVNRHLAITNNNSFVAKFFSHRVSILRDDGTSFYNLDDALQPPQPDAESTEGQKASTATSVPRTVEEAFGFLYDTPDGYGAVGWLHFRDLPLKINVVCKLPMTTKDRSRAHQSNATQGHQFAIEGSNLLFLTVDDVRKVIGDRVKVPSSHLIVLDPESSSDDEGLTGDVDLFRYLRTFGAFTLRVVKREGITVHVKVIEQITNNRIASVAAKATNPQSKVLSLPRLPFDTTIEQVRARLEEVFGTAVPFLFLDGVPDMLAHHYTKRQSSTEGTSNSSMAALGKGNPYSPLFESEVLIDLSINGKDVYLSNAPIGRPEELSSQQFLENKNTLVNERVHTATNVSHRQQQTSYHRSSLAEYGLNSSAAVTINHPPSTHSAHSINHSTPLPLPVTITAKVSVEIMGTSSSSPSRRHGGGGANLSRDDEVVGGEVVDITLPNDGAPFTVMEMKEFIVNSVLHDSQYHELCILHGRKVLPDESYLQSLLDFNQDRKMDEATILLTCRYRPQ